jgi:hypothetical protein
MTLWTQRTAVPVAANGTTSASAPFATPAAGALLVAFAASATTLSTPAGWTLTDSSVTTGAAYLWTKTATGSETAVPLTLGIANQPVMVNVYELPPGSSIIATADQELASSGVASAGLAGMVSTAKLLMHFGCFVSNDNTNPPYGLSWDDPPANAITDSWYGLAAPGGSVASKLMAGYLEDSVLTTWQPRNFLDGTGLAGTSNRITAAFSVPESLDSPTVTSVVALNPTTEGGTDGSITLAWSPVDGAGTYEVGHADGIGAESGFVDDSLNATSPYTIVGLGAGPYTWRVRAVPPA